MPPLVPPCLKFARPQQLSKATSWTRQGHGFSPRSTRDHRPPASYSVYLHSVITGQSMDTAAGQCIATAPGQHVITGHQLDTSRVWPQQLSKATSWTRQGYGLSNSARPPVGHVKGMASATQQGHQLDTSRARLQHQVIFTVHAAR